MSYRDDTDLVGGEVENLTLRTADVHAILGGVSVPWMMKAFAMGRQTIERKLRGCTPIGQGKHNTPLYDLAEAASYLVTPRVDLEEYLKGLKPEQLPERLRESYWNSMLKRQRWEEKAGHLWRTETVVDRLTPVLLAMRNQLQLLPDSIERVAGLTPKQMEAVQVIVDGIQADMHRELLAFAERGSTPSQLAELDDELEDDDLI